ncbi:DUF3263 domain-containing protein [Rhodococcus koreensis]|uniref:DUF3263 domain-containing protein n=1 Tax=Rhodococcus koreensis TaxID=99653 RepID=UPI001981F609|nr:DUF3263 domain-containing protein [Rhodococcus koreensis]QSE86908.1 DUF3263 domain-containing protein [Rhodococcus koreensis]
MSTSSIIEDTRIIEFARRWLPYGGGTTGDLLVEFGMTPACYLARLGKILDSPAGRQLDPQLRADLLTFVATRTPTQHPTGSVSNRTVPVPGATPSPAS